ncbi:hypothetical protein Smp_186520 [Schistosoma mansoni]|uniref:hypothetical protein n=1 Tax=Schistosoma mansoni TaxID=6183 RepID=UPI00019B3748|nr:hypothetical protein Smp_186520 [Schistosoma mansoni]|eukprot:XP_018644082.1 hypothetical protein Smp_186520 [Schistosoma mansoni]
MASHRNYKTLLITFGAVADRLFVSCAAGYLRNVNNTRLSRSRQKRENMTMTFV